MDKDYLIDKAKEQITVLESVQYNFIGREV